MTASGSVLLVEDDPAIRGLLSLIFDGEGFTVETADDGKVALDKVQRRRPDAIVLDLILPVLNGWELIDLLDQDDRTRDIPIITMSGLHRYSSVGERGVKAFLSKPFDVDTLLTVLEDVGNWHDGQSRSAGP